MKRHILITLLLSDTVLKRPDWEGLTNLEGDELFYVVGGGHDSPEGQELEAEVTSNPIWQRLPAVQAGNAHRVSAEHWMSFGGLASANAVLADVEQYLTQAGQQRDGRRDRWYAERCGRAVMDKRIENVTEKNPFRLEETSDLLISYTGNKHIGPKIYQRFFDAWVSRLGKGERFGVILVTEPHEHHEDEERDPNEEDRYTRILSDFRREHRERASEVTTGFSRVFPPEMLAGMDEEKSAQYRERTRRYAEYMFGVRGENFTSLDDAKRVVGVR